MAVASRDGCNFDFDAATALQVVGNQSRCQYLCALLGAVVVLWLGAAADRFSVFQLAHSVPFPILALPHPLILSAFKHTIVDAQFHRYLAWISEFFVAAFVNDEPSFRFAVA